jgi:hypothetical protein
MRLPALMMLKTQRKHFHVRAWLGASIDVMNRNMVIADAR